MKVKERFNRISKGLKRRLKLYKMVLKDKRTPIIPKIMLGAAVGYLLMPFDLIPDFIPGLGQLDDVVIIPSLVYFANKLIPKHIIEEYKIELDM